MKQRIGINERYEEYFITDYELSFLNLHISEYANISELNQFAEKVEELSDYDYEKLSAVLEMEGSLSIAEPIEESECRLYKRDGFLPLCPTFNKCSVLVTNQRIGNEVFHKTNYFRVI